jgi:hypothetical protein
MMADLATPVWTPTLVDDIRRFPAGRRAGREAPAATVTTLPDDRSPFRV